MYLNFDNISVSLSKSLAILLLIIIAACSTTPAYFQKQELLTKATATNKITCDHDTVNHCSIESPLQELADQVFAAKEQGDTNQYATIMDIGEKSLEARIHLIRAARKTIEVQTFIWANDEVGNLIGKELIAAANRGVKVRIIGDQMYSASDPEKLAQVAVAHENLKIKLYNPLNYKAVSSSMDISLGAITQFSTLNHRMHNKLMVFDGRIGITGGRNIENKYFNWDLEFNFLDRDVLVVGPVSSDMQKAFDRYWDDPITVALDQLTDIREKLFVDGKQIPLPSLTFPDFNEFDDLIIHANNSAYIAREFIDTAHAVTDIKFTADPPQKPFLEDKAAIIGTTKGLRQIIEGAEHSVLMQTPYFIISSPAYKLLKNLRKQHPDIEYTVATNSLATTDNYIVYGLSLKRKKRNVKNLDFGIHELNPAPGDILKMMPRYSILSGQKGADKMPTEYDPAESTKFERYVTVPVKTQGPKMSIHAKSMVVDGEVAVVGSHNFDPRGAAINTEVTLTVRDKSFANELSESINLVLQPQNSWIIAPRQRVPLVGHITEVLETVSRMLPVFDLWPFRYTTSFELHDGMEPVSPAHPNFYQNYKDVGQFPGTALSDDQIKTLLVSGFGAVAEPLM